MSRSKKLIFRVSLEMLLGTLLLISLPAVAYSIVVDGPEPRELVTMALCTAIVMAVAAWVWVDVLLATRELQRTLVGCFASLTQKLAHTSLGVSRIAWIISPGSISHPSGSDPET